MTLKDHFAMLAAYNGWANRRLYAAAARLSDADYRADGGAFFRSIHGTLNHLLVTDRVWLARCTGAAAPSEPLDAILHDRFVDLERARRVDDERIVRYVDTLDDATLDGVIRYRRVSTPDVMTQALAPAIAHWFNHQTHHRGQAHALLSGLGHPPPELDLLFFQREVDAAAGS